MFVCEVVFLLWMDEDVIRVLVYFVMCLLCVVMFWMFVSVFVGVGFFVCVDGMCCEVKYCVVLGEVWEIEWGALDLGERATRATAAL